MRPLLQKEFESVDIWDQYPALALLVQLEELVLHLDASPAIVGEVLNTSRELRR